MSSELSSFKPSHSDNEGGACLEVAPTPTPVHIRDVKTLPPTAPVLTVAPGTWGAFLATLRHR